MSYRVIICIHRVILLPAFNLVTVLKLSRTSIKANNDNQLLLTYINKELVLEHTLDY
jgi:hypothetical protein